MSQRAWCSACWWWLGEEAPETCAGLPDTTALVPLVPTTSSKLTTKPSVTCRSYNCCNQLARARIILARRQLPQLSEDDPGCCSGCPSQLKCVTVRLASRWTEYRCSVIAGAEGWSETFGTGEAARSMLAKLIRSS